MPREAPARKPAPKDGLDPRRIRAELLGAFGGRVKFKPKEQGDGGAG